MAGLDALHVGGGAGLVQHRLQGVGVPEDARVVQVGDDAVLGAQLDAAGHQLVEVHHAGGQGSVSLGGSSSGGDGR